MVSFATSSRSEGWKSSAAIDPETSRAITMSTPSARSRRRDNTSCGRANATASGAKADAASTPATTVQTRWRDLPWSARAARGNG